MVRPKGKKVGYFIVGGKEGFTGYIASDATYGPTDLWPAMDTAIGGKKGY